VTPPARPVAPGLVVSGPDGPRLVVGRCPSCERVHFPLAEGCPWCGTEGASPAQAGPWARLWLWTAVSVRPPGYRGPLPYGFGIVELEDVPLRVVTRLGEAEPARLHEGQQLRLVVDRLCTDDDGTAVEGWAFAPVAPG